MAKAFVRGLRNYGFDKFDSIRFIDKETYKVRELFDFAIMLGATEERLVYGDPIDLANDSAYDRLKKTLTDVDLLFNFSTYRYALNVLNASIEAKCHYVILVAIQKLCNNKFKYANL